jgi:hypothetical protein
LLNSFENGGEGGSLEGQGGKSERVLHIVW